MSTKYSRPAGAYDSTSVIINKDKYQDDSGALPKIAISSSKVDGDLNYLIDSVNTLDDDINSIVAAGLPSQTSNADKFIHTDGAAASWAKVDTINIIDNAITSAKILAGAVTESKILNNSVTASKINADAVITAKILDANVTTSKIADDAITQAKINDNAVGLAEMAGGTAGNLITYDAAGDPAAVATGTAGQVLTSGGAGVAPTMQDAAAGGAWNLIASATASAVTSVDFTSGIDSTYDTYKLILSGVNLSTTATPFVRFSTDGGSTWDATTKYNTVAWFREAVTPTSANTQGSVASAQLNPMGTASFTAAAVSSINAEMTFFNLPSTSLYKVLRSALTMAQSTTSIFNFISSGSYENTSAVDGIRVFVTAGNIASGEFYLYGLKKS